MSLKPVEIDHAISEEEIYDTIAESKESESGIMLHKEDKVEENGYSVLESDGYPSEVECGSIAELWNGECNTLQVKDNNEINNAEQAENEYSTLEINYPNNGNCDTVDDLSEGEYNTLQHVKENEITGVKQVGVKYSILKRNILPLKEDCDTTAKLAEQYSTLQLVKDEQSLEGLSLPVLSDVKALHKQLTTKMVFFQRKTIITFLILTFISVALLTVALLATGTVLFHKQKMIDELNVAISSNKNVSSLLRQQIQMLKRRIMCISHNNTPSIPVTSCRALPKSSPSGYYWVTSANSSAIRVYCDMTRTCGPITGGWMRVASINMNHTSSKCPSNLCLEQSPVRACKRCSALSYHSTQKFHVGVSYSKVCGRIIGYASETPDAFSPDIADTIDGVILLYGSLEVFIWSFAAAVYQPHKKSLCPCTSGDFSFVPEIISGHYFCETVRKKVPTSEISFETPLWDGAGCKETDVCCSFNNPPWFYRELPATTAENIQMKINLDESREDIAVAMIDIYVQ